MVSVEELENGGLRCTAPVTLPYAPRADYILFAQLSRAELESVNVDLIGIPPLRSSVCGRLSARARGQLGLASDGSQWELPAVVLERAR
jgi:hypothetical protein